MSPSATYGASSQDADHLDIDSCTPGRACLDYKIDFMVIASVSSSSLYIGRCQPKVRARFQGIHPSSCTHGASQVVDILSIFCQRIHDCPAYMYVRVSHVDMPDFGIPHPIDFLLCLRLVMLLLMINRASDSPHLVEFLDRYPRHWGFG